jgi:glycosyltransferase involved in cell wall biosynthesis
MGSSARLTGPRLFGGWVVRFGTLRRVLVVAYPYPPMPSTGANRWTAMGKYLASAGHAVTVVTTSAFGSADDDGPVSVVRTGDLIASPQLRSLLRRPALPAAGGSVSTDKPPPALLTRVVVPDIYALTWVPGALRATRRLLRAHPFDCVITSSPWESGHLVGLGLGRERPAWIADFRDSWCFEPWRDPFPTAIQRRLDSALERRVVRGADGVVAVHGVLAEDFARRFGVSAAHIPNGWDPDLDDRPADAPALAPAKLSIVHTGKLWGGWGRTPAALFEALRRLRLEQPDLEERVELVVAGRLDTEEERLLAEADLGGLVRHTGVISRAAATALQRDADVLLLLTSRRLSWEAPGKLFEYLSAGRPILCLAEANEAARIVTDTGTGVCVAPDDPEAIAAALRDVMEHGLEDHYSPRGLERYVYPAPAQAMAAEIERAVAQRRTRATA